MKHIAFKETHDIAPIPFTEPILVAANRLRELGLKRHPHVGCFVWDRMDNIPVPSPFPLNVYFILSLPRFTTIFGSLDNMQTDLVWVPTWHQACLLCRRMALPESVFMEKNTGVRNPEYEPLLINDQIADALRNQGRSSSIAGPR